MNQALKWVWLVLAFAPAVALAGHPTEQRRADESYLTAFADARATEPAPPAGTSTPWVRQKPLEQLDVMSVPAVASADVLQKMFERVRDERAWQWSGKPGFGRRIPWLYHFDGCYLRAELVASKFREWGYVSPRQILAFGNLSAATSYGTATWWYHVAPVLRVGTQVYVLDVSLDALHPLTVEAWVLKMAPSRAAAMLSICSEDATDPEGDCDAAENAWDDDYKSDQTDYYLGQEWKLLQQAMGTEPADVLGEHPPWQGRH